MKNINTPQLLKTYLSDKKMRNTTGRSQILNEILRINKHFTADEIYRNLKKQHSKIALASVYNTLDLFVSLGIITKNRLGAEQTVYETVIDKKGHHHLVCLKCNQTIEFSAEELSTYEMKIAELNHFKIINSTHQIFGFCKKCRKVNHQ